MFKSIFQYFIVAIILCSSILVAQSGVISKGNKKYLPNQLIVKLNKDQTGKRLNKSFRQEGVEEALQNLGAREMVNLFNISEKETGVAAEAIRDIYTVTFDSNEDPEELSRKLKMLNGVEWAEPNFVREIFYTPGDTLYTKIVNDQFEQWGLYKVQAAEAWDISTGDTTVVIAIVDTGIYWDHPDLRKNIWQNLGEDLDGDGRTIEFHNDEWIFDPDDINGIDDDGNGYIDDLVGWDFQGWDGTSDNDPVEDSPAHGTHVAGTASAVTDNVLGIASLGFNCKLMGVKSSQHTIGDSFIVNGHMGIVYAAANGAKVINCSWGGAGFSMAEKSAVDYALERGALVVCSAGNDGNQDKNYPASYDGVLSVGNTSTNDSKAFSSNYGTTLDVMAPGSNILSTWGEIGYVKKSGTSMASPLVSGLAGLVFSHFNYTPEQVLEQIRVNCDDISANNPQFEFLIGGGRINAFKALSNNSSIAVRATDVVFIDQGDGDGRFESGETVLVRMNFVNYLNPVSSVNVNMVTENANINITNASFNTGGMNTLAQVSNNNNEFRFVIDANTPFDELVNIRLDFTQGEYTDFQWLSLNINTTYSNIASSNLATTITSDGSIGYNDYPNNSQGDGLTFLRGTNILWEGAFMYGTAEDRVMDAARLNNSSKSTDFEFVNPVQVFPGEIADEESYSSFNDNGAGIDRLRIGTELRTYSFGDQPDNNYIIFSYTLTNNSVNDITGLYAGIFFDLDLDETDYGDDKIGYDETDNFGYQFDDENYTPNIYVGASLLSTGNYGFYAIRSDGVDEFVSVASVFTEGAKWRTLSSGTSHSSVLTRLDLAFVVSGGPYDIPSSGNIEVAFVLAVGSDLEDLRATIQQSRLKSGFLISGVEDEEGTIPTEFSLSQNYPNPFNPATVINYQLATESKVVLKVYNLLGKEVATLVNEFKDAGSYKVNFDASSLPSGVYFYRLQAGSFNESRKMILLK